MDCSLDEKDILMISSLPLDYSSLKNKCILITGANGLIGSALVDAIMKCESLAEQNVHVVALSRNGVKAKTKFNKYINLNRFTLIVQDVCSKIIFENDIDYIIHAASPSHPLAYSQCPVDVLTSNFLGALNALEKAHENQARMLYISSGEVYGKSTANDGGMDEGYLGMLDFLDKRSCYPEAKRASENLCISFKSQFEVDVVIARPCHIYGPGITDDNSRADAQFLRNAINNEDIVLKSSGSQKRSYCYISDCVSALFYIMLTGSSGEAYNIANKESVVTIKEYAQILADLGRVSISHAKPSETEAQGYTKNNDTVLNVTKLEGLGWRAQNNIRQGLYKTFVATKRGY